MIGQKSTEQACWNCNQPGDYIKHPTLKASKDQERFAVRAGFVFKFYLTVCDICRKAKKMKRSGLLAGSLPTSHSKLSATPCTTPRSLRRQAHYGAVAFVGLLSLLLPQWPCLRGRDRKLRLLWERGIKRRKVYCSAR